MGAALWPMDTALSAMGRAPWTISFATLCPTHPLTHPIPPPPPPPLPLHQPREHFTVPVQIVKSDRRTSLIPKSIVETSEG